MDNSWRRPLRTPGGVAPPRHSLVLAADRASAGRARISASPTGTERNRAGQALPGGRTARSNRASPAMACGLNQQGLQADSQHSVQNPKKRLEKPLRFERIHRAPQVALPRDPRCFLRLGRLRLQSATLTFLQDRSGSAKDKQLDSFGWFCEERPWPRTAGSHGKPEAGIERLCSGALDISSAAAELQARKWLWSLEDRMKIADRGEIG